MAIEREETENTAVNAFTAEGENTNAAEAENENIQALLDALFVVINAAINIHNNTPQNMQIEGDHRQENFDSE